MADEATIQEIVARPYTRMFTPDDGMYVGRVLEFPGCHAEGEDIAEALTNLDEALAGIVDSMLDHGDAIPEPLNTREYSGRLALRLPPSLHGRIAERAALEGISLNRWLSDAIAAAAGDTKPAA